METSAGNEAGVLRIKPACIGVILKAFCGSKLVNAVEDTMDVHLPYDEEGKDRTTAVTKPAPYT